MSISNKHYRKIVLIFTLIGLMTSATIVAQKTGLNLEANLGTSIISPLRAFHTDLVEQVSFENFKTTDNHYYNYGFTVGFTLEDSNSSFFYMNRVSGAKTSVADFSGFLRLTNELNGHTFGYKYFLPIGNNTDKNMFIQLKGLATWSVFNITSDTSTTGGITMFDDLDFNALDFGLGAGFLYEYPLGFLVLRAYIDLDIYYGGKMKLKDSNIEDGFLTDSRGNKLTTGWTGLTTGLGVTIPI